MLKIIDKYILKQFLKNFSLCLLMFASIFIIVDVFDRLDDFIEKGISLFTIGKFYLNYTPVTFVTIVPPASLVSALYVLGNMNKTNEITALKSSGMSVYRILMPFFVCAAVLWGMVFFINEQFVPSSNATWQYMTKFEFQSKERKKTRKIHNFGFADTKGHLFYVEEINPYTKQMRNVTILSENNKGEITEKLTAKTASWHKTQLTFNDVFIFDYSKKALAPEQKSTFSLTLNKRVDFFIRFGALSEFMNRSQLKQYMQSLSKLKQHLIPELLVDYHSKLALPISSVLILLLGIFCAFQTQKRGGALLSVGLSAMLFFGFYIVLSLATASGKGGILPPLVAAWLPNTVLFIAAIILAKRIKT